MKINSSPWFGSHMHLRLEPRDPCHKDYPERDSGIRDGSKEPNDGNSSWAPPPPVRVTQLMAYSFMFQATTRTSTRPWTTPPTWASCSAARRTPWCPTGSTFLSATTAGPPALSSQGNQRIHIVNWYGVFQNYCSISNQCRSIEASHLTQASRAKILELSVDPFQKWTMPTD